MFEEQNVHAFTKANLVETYWTIYGYGIGGQWR
jgi:hypothetical protein